MKRTPFKRKRPEWTPTPKEDRPMAFLPAKVECRSSYGAAATVAVPKVVPLHCKAYRQLVAAMPCKNCGIVGYSQAAHPNQNKGMGTKTDDRLCFALCGPRPGVPGCHALFDQGYAFTKAARRALEAAWGADTRRAIVAAGDWPAGLPIWRDDDA